MTSILRWGAAIMISAFACAVAALAGTIAFDVALGDAGVAFRAIFVGGAIGLSAWASTTISARKGSSEMDKGIMESDRETAGRKPRKPIPDARHVLAGQDQWVRARLTYGDMFALGFYGFFGAFVGSLALAAMAFGAVVVLGVIGVGISAGWGE